MIVTMNRQDLQGVVDYAKDRIIQRMVTKEDLSRACNAATDRVIDDLQDIRKANLPYIKQNIALTEQAIRRTQALDSRLNSLEQSLKDISGVMLRMWDTQAKTASALQRF